MTASRLRRTTVALTGVVALTTAALIGSAGVALAEPPTEAADINLLNDLNVCPGLTAGIGLGNLLGLLGEGTANPVTNGGDVLCVIDADRDRPGTAPDPDAPGNP